MVLGSRRSCNRYDPSSEKRAFVCWFWKQSTRRRSGGQVALSEAVYAGSARVEDVEAVRMDVDLAEKRTGKNFWNRNGTDLGRKMVFRCS